MYKLLILKDGKSHSVLLKEDSFDGAKRKVSEVILQLFHHTVTERGIKKLLKTKIEDYNDPCFGCCFFAVGLVEDAHGLVEPGFHQYCVSFADYCSDDFVYIDTDGKFYGIEVEPYTAISVEVDTEIVVSEIKRTVETVHLQSGDMQSTLYKPISELPLTGTKYPL